MERMGSFLGIVNLATCWIYGSQSRRNKKAAKRFFRKLLKGLQDVPLVIGTELQEEKPLQRGLAKISFVSIRERKGWSLLLDKELFSKNMAQKYWLATSCPSDAP